MLPQTLLALGKLALPLAGHCSKGVAPALWGDVSISHHRQGRTDPDGMGVEELALPPHLKQVNPVA